MESKLQYAATHNTELRDFSERLTREITADNTMRQKVREYLLGTAEGRYATIWFSNTVCVVEAVKGGKFDFRMKRSITANEVINEIAKTPIADEDEK